MYERCLFGRPEEIEKKIAGLQGSGITELGLATLMPPLRAEQAMRSLRLLPRRTGGAMRAAVARSCLPAAHVSGLAPSSWRD